MYFKGIFDHVILSVKFNSGNYAGPNIQQVSVFAFSL